ncbi:PREDICTED: homeobox protein Hox-A4-like [Rhagoletis zephyria]|uniref:homeobox protein Hox-A4-like n=1 Tax=Rhagoletis zephyria TaxID=28612 RepID=UPI0008115826|nr:PREDICTED: homeobox protein Hox-A4-like [Rhagoletis zephyria]
MNVFMEGNFEAHVNTGPYAILLTPEELARELAIEPALKRKASSPELQNDVKPKRMRHCFTKKEVDFLEYEFKKSKILAAPRRKEISHILGIQERSLKIWFQNRRRREKQMGQVLTEVNDLLAASESALNLSEATAEASAREERGNFTPEPEVVSTPQCMSAADILKDLIELRQDIQDLSNMDLCPDLELFNVDLSMELDLSEVPASKDLDLIPSLYIL